jgi:hypothetical protein
MELAYPGAPATIPSSKLPYYEIVADRPLTDLLPPSKIATGLCQELRHQNGDLHGYEFRLGCVNYPHIKLRIQSVDFQQRKIWVYSVDTHDGFKRATSYLPTEEADKWRTMVEQNRQLKHQIETALMQAGYLTPKSLLQADLPVSTTPS